MDGFIDKGSCLKGSVEHSAEYCPENLKIIFKGSANSNGLDLADSYHIKNKHV